VAPPFIGVGVALVTLFDDDGALDAPATAERASRSQAAPSGSPRYSRSS
jgi:dihydrodipicolinate synthase/N-acetylneuraminate lyase